MKPPNPIRLYRHPLSGHSHRVELLLSLLGLPYELVHVDLLAGEQKRAPFLAMNSFGQVPVIADGDVVVPDSNAILLYLGERYDEAGRFWPRTPEGRAAVQRWFSVAAGPLAAGPGAARLARVFGRNLDYPRAVETAVHLLTQLDRELSQRDFLVGGSPTLADVALYAYVAHAPEGDVSLEPYAAVRAWLLRLQSLPGFVPMQATVK
jgi:glutathione S-transferase